MADLSKASNVVQENTLSKASNVVQDVFFLYNVTGFTQICHSIPVATSCISTSWLRLVSTDLDRVNTFESSQ